MSAKKFAHPTVMPEGFLYQPDFLSESEEAELLCTVETLQLGAYDFRGYIAKRRVVAYGGVMIPALGAWRSRIRFSQIS